MNPTSDRPKLEHIRELISKEGAPRKPEGKVAPNTLFDNPVSIKEVNQLKDHSTDSPNPADKTIKLPSLHEFENVLNDKERALALYEAILDTHQKIISAMENTSSSAPAKLPPHWTIQTDPQFEQVTARLLEEFHSPRSNYFIPESDDEVLDWVKEWAILPEKVFQSNETKEKILNWVRTTFLVERAMVRKKVLGLSMSTRKYRALDAVSLTKEILPEGKKIHLSQVKRSILLRVSSKDGGCWDNKDSENLFWEHYLTEYGKLSHMAPEQVNTYWMTLVQLDEKEHGTCNIEEIDVCQTNLAGEVLKIKPNEITSA
ncbi:hypothetical protein K7432_009787 [Basidiobolus ranarum]|uniref:Uncharacterized protein n=1 Tax=Basidiobolus ranarum TaxID=34480 RepID=A0ABR2VWY5_9FUNG